MSKASDRAAAEVQALFNAKAKTWNAKYRNDGPLAFRVSAFRELLAGRVPAKAKVLDLGCGTGAIASALSANGLQLTACDIAEEMIAAGKRNYGESAVQWRLLSPDWKQLPFGACSFDAIIASSILEYLPDLDAVLVECQRILEPGGVLIASVPNVRTLTRKLERLARPTAVLLNGFAALRRVPRVHAYTTYLKCSLNRLSVDGWREAGRRAQFARTDWIEAAGANGSLIFLVFYKATTEVGQ